MKKIFKLFPFTLILFVFLMTTYSYYLTSSDNESIFKSEKYFIKLNGNGGIYNKYGGLNIVDNKVNLPIPERLGYTFSGYDKKYNSINDINNKELNAKWDINTYLINYNLNGGLLNNLKNTYTVEDSFKLGVPYKDGNNFIGWTGSNGDTPSTDVEIKSGTTGNLNFNANWDKQSFNVKIGSIIQNNRYDNGLDGFYFSVWIDDVLVADHVTNYSNSLLYGSKLRVYVYDRDGYSVKSFRDNTWVINNNLNIDVIWYDDIAPIITSFSVTNLGYYDPKYGDLKGWNVRVYVNGYDNGTGIYKYQTWLKPYGSGSGAARKDGNDRIMKNVLYLEEVGGRTFCAYAIDNAGNEAEKCETIKV